MADEQTQGVTPITDELTAVDVGARTPAPQQPATTPVTPGRQDITAKLYPDLVFEDDTLTVMAPEERKRRLSRFAREDTYTPEGRPHRTSAIQSIQELNKMDGSYAPLKSLHGHRVVFEIVHTSRRKQLEGGNDDAE